MKAMKTLKAVVSALLHGAAAIVERCGLSEEFDDVGPVCGPANNLAFHGRGKLR